MTTVIHYFGPETETNDENISECALRAIENSDVKIKLHDYNKFDVLVKFEDDDPATYTFEIHNSHVVYKCPSCAAEVQVYYDDNVNQKTIISLVSNIIEHRRKFCLANIDLFSIRRDLLISLNCVENHEAYAIAASIYYLAEIIRRMR